MCIPHKSSPTKAVELSGFTFLNLWNLFSYVQIAVTNAYPIMTNKIFNVFLSSSIFNSCGRTSKNVTYKKVPVAIACRTPEKNNLIPESNTLRTPSPSPTPSGVIEEKMSIQIIMTPLGNSASTSCTPMEKAITLLCINKAMYI